MKLNRRTLLYAALAVVIAGLVWPLWKGFTENCNRARSQARQAELRLQQAADLRERVLGDRADRDSLEQYVRARGKDFDLYSYVNGRVKTHHAEKIVKLTSSGTSSAGRAMQAVTLEFKDAPLKKVLDVIHHTYYGKNLIVLDRLHHLRPARSGQGVDCELTLVSPQS